MSDQNEVSSTSEDREKIEPVLATPPVVRKRTMVDVVVDRAAEASVDLVKNVVLPGIRDTLADSFHGLIDAMFDTKTQGRRRASRGTTVVTSNQTSFNYNGISKQAVDRKRSISEKARSNHDFGEIIFQSRPEANDVIDTMRVRLNKYGTVTVDDLYSIIGVDPTVVDTSWGWDEGSFAGAHVRRIRSGFVLDIPEPSPL